MENKKTSELLDLLGEKNKSGETKLTPDEQEEILGELRNREPFFTLMHPDWEESLPYTKERVDEVEEDIKKLKRHKHDQNGDVLIRI